MINFIVAQTDLKAFITIDFDGNLTPNDLKSVQPPDPISGDFAKKLVILSGRAPIWLYAFLVHYYHPVKAVAVFDPRLDGGVVVQSHSNDYSVGDLVRFD